MPTAVASPRRLTKAVNPGPNPGQDRRGHANVRPATIRYPAAVVPRAHSAAHARATPTVPQRNVASMSATTGPQPAGGGPGISRRRATPPQSAGRR